VEGSNPGMEVTTASAPVYDKTNTSRWKFLGVAAFDLTVCNLEKALLDKNPTMQDAPPMPEATKFSGCTCALSYTYNGITYEGGACTSDSWPVPWCMTDGCGIRDSSMDTGYWADCKPFGARATLQEVLMRSGEEGSTEDLDPCELEALRPVENQCRTVASGQQLPNTCTQEKVNELRTFNYYQKLPGFDNVVEADWQGNTGGSYSDAEWSMNEGSCDQCNNDQMKPQCALPAKCNAGIQVPDRFDSSAKSHMMPSYALSSMLLLVTVPLALFF